MLIASAAVHEIDVARFVLGREVRRVTVVLPRQSALAGFQDPLLLLLEMDDGAVVDVEVFLNAQYGHDVRAELVCEKGTVALAPPRDVTVMRSAQEGAAFPADGRPRFAAAHHAELQGWMAALRGSAPVGASAWDGYAAAAVAAAGLRSLASGRPADVELAPRPLLYG
jgi:myo-inositol 2-dehydrogenase/D-chiro-inositol 1-dehydrogenase